MAPEETRNPDAQLVRAIGIPGLAANIVNTTIGASIFILPATIAGKLGPAAPLAFIVCAIAQAIFVTCFAMAGSRVSLTGGLYAYVEVAFGRYVGFLAGLLNCTTAILSVSAVMNVLANTAGSFAPVLAGGVGRFFIMLIVVSILAAINVRSVRTGTGTVTFITIVKVLPLLLFVGVGIFFIKPELIRIAAPAHDQSLGEAVLLLMFAFFGIESSLTPSGEVRNPARTVPRAVYLALLLTTTIYILIQLVAQGTLGGDRLSQANAPLAESAFLFLGDFGRVLLLVGAGVSSFGYLASDILNTPRTLFAFGRDGILPKAMAHVHPRFRSPDVAIIFYAAIALSLSLISTFEGLAVMANVAALLLYLLCSAAAWQLVRRDVRTGGGAPFGFAGARILPFIAIAIIGWMLAQATMKELTVLGIVLAVGTLLYWSRLLIRADKTARA